MTEVKETDVLADRYRLDKVAAMGGMGLVFRATDLTLGVTCAVKVIANRPGSRQTTRFLRETRTLRSLRHPAVVRYLDSGVHADDVEFLVMEWVGGENLRERLRTSPFNLQQTLAMLHRLVDALAAIHGAGVVHRDIKPPNLMIPEEGGIEAIRIVDFGIARVPAPTSRTSNLTSTGLQLGTPGYMAPEQILTARTVDGRADVFSLACVAFEMLTGRRAFTGDDALAMLSRVVIEDAPRLRTLRSELPQAVDDLIAAMMSRDVNARPFAGEPLLRRIQELRQRFEGSKLSMPALVHSKVPTATAEHDVLDQDAGTQDDEPLAHSLEATLGTSTPNAFHGRIAPLASLEASVIAGRVCAVSGPTGVGKSRLVIELAWRLDPHRAVVFVDASHAHDMGTLLRAIAARLNQKTINADARELLAFFDEHRDGVLILDGIDLVSSTLAAVVGQWLEAGSFAIVVSARTRQAWAHSWHELEPLTTDAAEGLSEAASLLSTRAREAGAVLTEDDEAVMPALAAELEGNPLGIEVAAAQIAVHGARQVLARLERPLAASLLADNETTTPALERALDIAWSGLSPDDQDVLTRLAPFEGNLDIEELGDLLATERAHVIISRLRALALVSGNGDLDIALSSAVRDYLVARGLAKEAAAAHRHVSWVVERCERLATKLDQAHDATAAAQLDRRANDLLVISHREDLLAARATLALDPAIAGRVPSSAHHALLDRAVTLSENAEAHVLAANLTRARGRVRALLGRFDEARADASSALAFAEGAGRITLAVRCLLDLCVVAHMTGDIETGERYCRSALELRGDFLGPRLEARAIGNLGALLHDAGQLNDAYSHYVEAIALAEAARDDRLLGVFLTNLAVLDADRGHPVRAHSRLRRAVAVLDRAGERWLLAMALGNLGMVKIELEQLERARPHLERACRMLANIGDGRSEALSRARLGLAHVQCGDFLAAAAALATAARLARADEKTIAVVEVFASFLRVARGEIDVDEARRALEAVRLSNGRTLLASSDDARAALRVLRAWG